jgi:hypothetical protein
MLTKSFLLQDFEVIRWRGRDKGTVLLSAGFKADRRTVPLSLVNYLGIKEGPEEKIP